METGKVLSVAAIFVMVLVLSSGTALSGAKVVEFDDIKFNAAATLSDNLKSLEGKVIFVTISSGERIGGTVKSVGDNLLHLKELTGGKDFHDALIRIDKIIAIDTKVRGYQR